MNVGERLSLLNIIKCGQGIDKSISPVNNPFAVENWTRNIVCAPLMNLN